MAWHAWHAHGAGLSAPRGDKEKKQRERNAGPGGGSCADKITVLLIFTTLTRTAECRYSCFRHRHRLLRKRNSYRARIMIIIHEPLRGGGSAAAAEEDREEARWALDISCDGRASEDEDAQVERRAESSLPI